MLIKKKFQLAVFMAIFIVLLVGAVMFFQQKSLQGNQERHTLNVKFAEEIYDLNFITYDYLQEKSERAVTQWQRQYLHIGTYIKDEEERHLIETTLIVTMRQDYESLGLIFAKINEETTGSSTGHHNLREERQKRLTAQLLIRSRALYSKSKKLIDASSQILVKKQKRIALVVFGLLIFFTLMLVVFMLYIGMPLYPRIAKLRKAFSKVADGNLDHCIEVKPGDEFSQVEASYNKTISQLAQITVSREKLEKEIAIGLEKQQRLEQLEKSLRLMTDSVFMFYSVSGKIFYSNEGAEQILGYTEKEFENLCFFDLMRKKDADTIRSFLINAGAEWNWQNYSFDVFGRQDQEINLDINIQYVAMENDQDYCIAIARDTSDRKAYERSLLAMQEVLEERVTERTTALQNRIQESEHLNRAMINLLDDLQSANKKLASTSEQLLNSNKELESFSYSVSHDLRAPLRALSGFSDLLKKRSQNVLDEKCLHYVDTISDSAKQMGTLIDDLLNFSRMGRKEMVVSQCNMDKIIQESLEILKPETAGRKISWQVDQLPEVFADSGLIRLVMTNLISNALKFTAKRENAEIIVGKEEQENKIVFFVQDNGAGFNMAYKDKLFGLFQRLHSQKEFKGTGVGLANVQRIVRRHGGDVWADGVVDRGATFYFSLPNRDKPESRKDDSVNYSV